MVRDFVVFNENTLTALRRENFDFRSREAGSADAACGLGRFRSDSSGYRPLGAGGTPQRGGGRANEIPLKRIS